MLVTGFGRFPGVEDNISAGFARDLGERLRVRHPAYDIRAQDTPAHDTWVLQLETVWARAAADLTAAMRAIQPDLVLMFGVSSTARGLVIERQAFNACAQREDAAGCLPMQSTLDTSEAAIRPSSLPVDAILHALVTAGCAVSQSDDPGRYLCNAVLFEALKTSEAMPAPPLTGFIHLPVAFLDDGGERAAALDACERLIEVCLAHLEARG